MSELLKWLQDSGGVYDQSAICLREVEGMGMGAFALRDIEEEANLFTIPDNLLLSACNSGLRPLIRADDWESLERSGGWASLMLCMMWEDAQGRESRWYGYLNGLPKAFDTPMFWSQEDLAHLQGTDIGDKLGRESADKAYNEQVKPLMGKYPEIFESLPSTSTSSTSPHHFSLEDYHVQGSRILSRSFTVQAARAGRTASLHKRDHEEQREERAEDGVTTEEEDEEEDDEEEEEEQVMVPLADMLNAAYERDNANLYHEEGCLKMVAIKQIKAGEQIYNTYGSPPNSHLLRKYGHVDAYPLDPELLSSFPEAARSWPYGNMGDEVDISGSEVVDACKEISGNGLCEDRVEWWLEEDEDDMFTLAFGDEALPPSLIAFTRLLLMSDAEWTRARDKGKLPKPKIELTVEGGKVLTVLVAVIQRRSERYGRDLEESLRSLEKDTLSLNERNAAIVRVGEQRVLLHVMGRLENMRGVIGTRTKRLAEGCASSKAKRTRAG